MVGEQKLLSVPFWDKLAKRARRLETAEGQVYLGVFELVHEPAWGGNERVSETPGESTLRWRGDVACEWQFVRQPDDAEVEAWRREHYPTPAERAEKVRRGAASGVRGLVVRNFDGEYVPAGENLEFCEDGWYVLVEFNDGSHLPLPLVVLPKNDEQGAEIIRLRDQGLFDGVIAEMQILGLNTPRYIAPDVDASLDPRLRGFFTVIS